MQVLTIKGISVQLSDADYDWASQWRWTWGGGRAGRRYFKRYFWIEGRRRWVYLHRAIWDRMGKIVPSGLHLDHKDRNPLNCQRENLRVLTPSANQANNGAKGYSWCKRVERWQVGIKKDQVRYHLGYFTTEPEAAAAYEVGKRRFFPELFE